MSWLVLLSNVLLISRRGYALWFGGPPEWIAGGSLLLAALNTILCYSPLTVRFQAIETGLLATDLMLLTILVAIALRVDRCWPIPLAGLRLDTIGAHITEAIDAEIVEVTNALMISA